MKRYLAHIEKNDVFGSYEVEAANEEEAKQKANNLFWIDINRGLPVRVTVNEVDKDGAPIGA